MLTAWEMLVYRGTYYLYNIMYFLYIYIYNIYISWQSILSPNLHIAYLLQLSTSARILVILYTHPKILWTFRNNDNNNTIGIGLLPTDIYIIYDNIIIPLIYLRKLMYLLQHIPIHNDVMMNLCPSSPLIIYLRFFTEKKKYRSLSCSRCSSITLLYTTPLYFSISIKRSSI